ncbi:Hpt domain-containing protein [Roseovarius sp. C7]|uniref:Hpt domain-containing protein n=1 Tax=Roseovarius sp. C7 TaxID=3398643 RepID=UPI0039F6C409
MRSQFVSQLPEQAAAIRGMWSQFEEAPHRFSHVLLDIGRIAHRIAGTAATLGFPELGQLAASLEEAIGGPGDLPGDERKIKRLVAKFVKEMTLISDSDMEMGRA